MLKSDINSLTIEGVGVCRYVSVGGPTSVYHIVIALFTFAMVMAAILGVPVYILDSKMAAITMAIVNNATPL
jgi:hypothetical protein